MLCVLYYSAIFPFQRFATNMLESNLGVSAQTAADIFRWFPMGARPSRRCSAATSTTRARALRC